METTNTTKKIPSKFEIAACLLVSSLVLISCKATQSTTARVRADDAALNPKGIGLALSENTGSTLSIGIDNKTSGQITLCEAKTRIDNCGQATAVALASKPPVSDRLIFEAVITPETNGVFFAIAIDGKVALRFKLGDKTTPSPTPTPTPSTPPTDPNGPNQHPGDITGLTANEIRVMDLINQYRRSLGMQNCALDATMNDYAKQNSLIQERRKNSGHYTSTPTNGEIAFYGPVTPEETVQGWKDSKGHDEIMRTREYQTCGVSGGTNGNSWTVTFLL